MSQLRLLVGLVLLALSSELATGQMFSRSSFSYEDLKALIDDHHLTKIEQVLPRLPEELRRKYTLVYESRSIQGASREFPRVILYGGDATLLVAFNGKPDQAGFNDLEVIQFRNSTKEFELRRIRFPADGKEGPVDFSEKNPALCLSCHHQRPRPNWDAYPLWPGVYGSEDDNRRPSDFKSKEPLQPLFLNQEVASQGRYRYLLELPGTYQDHYFKRFTKEVSGAHIPDFTKWSGYETQRLKGYPVFDGPNNDLTEFLDELNTERIARMISREPKLQPYRYALLGALNSCETPEFIPEKVQKNFQKPYPEILDRVEKEILKEQADKVNRQKSIGGPFGEQAKKFFVDFREHHPYFPEKPEVLSGFAYILENLGLEMMRDWSMQFGSQYMFGDFMVSVFNGDLNQILWKEILSPTEDREVYQIYRDAWNSMGLTDLQISKKLPGQAPLCAILRKKSLAELN